MRPNPEVPAELKDVMWNAAMTGRDVHICLIEKSAMDESEVNATVQLADELGVDINYA